MTHDRSSHSPGVSGYLVPRPAAPQQVPGPQRPGRFLYRLLLALLLLATALPAGLTAWGVWLCPNDELQRADAIFVPNGDPGFRRTAKAADLYHDHWAKWLIVSGQGVGGDSAEAMAKVARDLGVPANAILKETRATSTLENAAFTAPLLQAQGIRSVLIVSSPYHLRRMKLTAAAHWPGVDLRTRRDDEPFDPYWWLTPEGRRMVGGETVKLVGYALTGRLGPF